VLKLVTPYSLTRTALNKLQLVALEHWYMLGLTVIVLLEIRIAIIAEVPVEVVKSGPVTVNWILAVPIAVLEEAVPEWRTRLLIWK